MILNLLLTWVNLQTFDTCIGRFGIILHLEVELPVIFIKANWNKWPTCLNSHLSFSVSETLHIILAKRAQFCPWKRIKSCSRSTWKQQTKRWSISCTLLSLRSKITYMYNRNWPQNTFLNITLIKSLHSWVFFFVWVCEIALTLVWSNIWSLLWFPPISQLKVGEFISPLSQCLEARHFGC